MDKWWWFAPFDGRWSREEVDARAQLAGAGGVVFALLMAPQLIFLPKLWNSSFVALVTVVPTFVISLMAARPVCNCLWPDIISRGDKKAAERAALGEL
jgi:ABC-type glycerol-3-phosphate transport system permease component